MQSTIKNRTVFCRDNLEILRGIDGDSVDLIYLDPPFNKKRQFIASIGSTAEGASFSDIFREEDVKAEWIGIIAERNPILANYLQGIGQIGHRSNKAYLCYMAIRLIEMHRVLKTTGSIYLHCDPTMSHYLKLLLDCIFGEGSFRNEVVWHYYNVASVAKSHFGRKHDIVFYYAKTDTSIFHWDDMREAYSEGSNWIKNSESYGDKHYKPNEKGKPMHDVWRMPTINNMAKERLGYPTQKPLALLDLIIKASSNEGDIVFDPFCGCATTLIAAERLNRRWIRIDISQKAYELVKERLGREIERPDEMFNEKTYLRTDIPQRTDVAPLPAPTTHKHLLYGNQQGNCNGCGFHFNYRNLEIDHIVPRSKGGGDDFENLQLLCGHCSPPVGSPPVGTHTRVPPVGKAH